MQNSGLIAVNDVVDERFHHIFKHATFNHMQSAILEQSLKDDCNMVVAAPTGSGKTVIHELAIIKLIAQNSKKSIKVVYVAPNKALCQQKLREWDEKFTRLGQVVMEVTGDIDLKQSMRFVAMANIIITTPEKWDSLTRVWKDHVFLLGAVDLLLIDEVHHLGEDRGATLEALVVRMKMLSSVYLERLQQSSPASEKPRSMRIIALSATLPNLADIGEWLGCRQDSTHYFDESFRPVPLTVHTLSMGSMNNAFLFDKSLDERVGPIVQRYSEGKQVLIFCASKKSTESLGSLLSQRIPIPATTLSLVRSHSHLIETAQDPSLRGLLQRGVAFHHSGVSPDDRALVERLYLLGAVYILCCTSTLAHGVNLPAHLVIIKGTSSWRGGSRGYERTSRADVIQMLGRAGRQGLDDTGVAVIMTSREDQDYYADVSLNAEIVESKLQTHLVEAICAEVTQTVITNATDCLAWMRNTFFYVRVRKNPAKYGFDPISDVDQLNTVLSTTCIKAIEDLSHYGLIVFDPATQQITALPEALIMTRNLIKFPTMQILVQVPSQTILPQLLRELSHSPELHKPVRRMEKATLNELMKHTRYPLKLRVQDPWHKVYVLMQAAIGNSDIKDFTLRVEQAEIVDCALRVLSALRELGICREVGTLLESTLVLDRSLRTRMWECHYGSIFTQCASLSPTVRNALTLRNVRTIGDVMGCSLSRVQEMCGGSQTEARAILGLAKTLYEGTLEVTASVTEGELTIKIASTTHNTSNSTGTISVDASYPQYTLLAYNVVTSKALCIRNIDRGTRTTQHSVDVGPLLPIEHIKCCLLCTNYVGIDSYQQAAVEAQNATPDSTVESTSTNTSRKKATTTQPTASPGTTSNTTHSNTTTNTTTTAKPSPARSLKQTTLRTTSVVDNGPQAGLHGTPYGVRTTTTGYNKTNSSNSNNNHTTHIGSSTPYYTPSITESTFDVEPNVLSSTNSEAIERARAYLNRSKTVTTASGNVFAAKSTSAPYANSATSTATSTAATTTNAYSNTGRNTSSNRQPFSNFAYTDLDDSALGLDEHDINLPYPSNLPSNTAHNSGNSYGTSNPVNSSDYIPAEEVSYEGEDISDYYYPTTTKTLPPLNITAPKTNISSYNSTSYSNNSPAYKQPPTTTNNTTDKARKTTTQPTADYTSKHASGSSNTNANSVSNEVNAMRRKAVELDLLSLPVQRINRQRVWGNANNSGHDTGTNNVPPTNYRLSVATVSPPTYSSPSTAVYPLTTQNENNSNSNNRSNYGDMGKKRSFFDRDGPVIPLCEEFDSTASDYYSHNYNNDYNNHYNNDYNNSNNNKYTNYGRPPTPILPHQQQHANLGRYGYTNPSQYTQLPLASYTCTAPNTKATTSVPSRSYPAMSPPATNYTRATTMGKENDAGRNGPAPVTAAPPTQLPVASPSNRSSSVGHKVSTLVPLGQNKNKDSISEAKKLSSAPADGEFDSIFF